MPPQPDIQKVYRDLLKPENLDLLIDLATEAFAFTVEVFKRAAKISPVNNSTPDPEDLVDVDVMLGVGSEQNAATCSSFAFRKS